MHLEVSGQNPIYPSLTLQTAKIFPLERVLKNHYRIWGIGFTGNIGVSSDLLKIISSYLIKM